jgi:hypothetical protein
MGAGIPARKMLKFKTHSWRQHTRTKTRKTS